jgi:hypothetical protein
MRIYSTVFVEAFHVPKLAKIIDSDLGTLIENREDISWYKGFVLIS